MKNQFPRMHVSLYVSNLHKTIEFYNSFFSNEPVKVKPGYAKYILDEPSLIISFVENNERVQENFGHLGFQVETEEDLNLKLWDAKKKNIVTKEEVGTSCCYAKQDKFWVNDPDGVQWEVYYFHEDVEFNDPHYELAEASACCTPADKTKKNLTELTPEKTCC
jgi:catechol 2,3-dioxygenase-like lactoylglutathione lyase family enzyme